MSLTQSVFVLCAAYRRQAQWVEVKGLAGRTGADSLTLSSGRQVWQGAGEFRRAAAGYQPSPVLHRCRAWSSDGVNWTTGSSLAATYVCY